MGQMDAASNQFTFWALNVCWGKSKEFRTKSVPEWNIFQGGGGRGVGGSTGVTSMFLL